MASNPSGSGTSPVASHIALLLTGFYFTVLLSAGTGYALDAAFLSGQAFYLAGLVVPAGYMGFCIFRPAFRKTCIRVLLGWLVLLGISIGLAMLFRETSYDGQTYHWTAFTAIRNGWNPWRTVLPESVPNAIFINHYPKGQEIFAGSAARVVANGELGKAAGPVLAFAALLYSFAAFRRWVSFRKAVLFSTLLVINPVIVCQLMTYMPDGQLACCILLLSIGLFNWYQGRTEGSWMSGFAATILIALKFTGLVYATLLFSIAGVFWILRARGISKPVLWFSGSSLAILLVATFYISFNPYGTHLRAGHHLFYPLMGNGAVNIMTGTNAPASFEARSRLAKLGASLFSQSRNIHGAQSAPDPILKVPLSFRLSEWTVFKSPSVLYGGLGPLFSGILVGTLLLTGLVCIQSKKAIKPVLLFTGLLLVLVLINPECWLARYVPQLWFLPVGILVLTYQLPVAPAAVRLIRNGLLILLAVNAVGILMINTASNAIITYQMKEEYRWLQATVHQPVGLAQRDFESVTTRLQVAHVPFYRIPNCEQLATCTLPDSVGFHPITTKATLLLPPGIPAYQPSGWFRKLSSIVSHGH